MLDLGPIKARLFSKAVGLYAERGALLSPEDSDIVALLQEVERRRAEVDRLQSNLDTVCEALSWYGNLVYSHTMGLPPEVQWIAENALEKVGRLKE